MFVVAAFLVTVRFCVLHPAKADAEVVHRLNYWSAAILCLAYRLVDAGLVLAAASSS